MKKLWDSGVSDSVRPLSREIQAQTSAKDESHGEKETNCGLLVEMFHRSGTEDDEEADPKRGSLEGDRLVGCFFVYFCIIGLEDHRIEEEREKAEDEKQLDKKNG
jgi:hypothetical protein